MRFVGGVLLFAAAYVTVQAGRNLATESGPALSGVGVTLAGASMVVLPVLGCVKLRLAALLGSRALRGDGILSTAGAALAGAAVLGLVLADTSSWWWTDSAAAIVIAVVLPIEGWRALRTAGA